MAGYLGLLLSAIVFAAAARILLGSFPGNHATKTNILALVGVEFFSAGIFFFLSFAIATAFKVSLNARDENELTIVSWMIGGLIGVSVGAWLITRPRGLRKGVPS